MKRSAFARSSEVVSITHKRALPTIIQSEDIKRRWSVELMKRIMRLGRLEFSTTDCYAFEGQLKALFPGSNQTQPEIRRYLQSLRDAGFLEHPARNRWRNNLLQD